jgi:hypothetical protein
MDKRLAQLQKTPPKRIRADVEKFTPFQDHFTFQVLRDGITDRSAAIAAETACIDMHNAVQGGANKLSTESLRDPKFWAMQYSRNNL